MTEKQKYFSNPANRRLIGQKQQIVDFARAHWSKECEQILRIADDACKNVFLFDLPWDMERTWEPVDFGENIDWEYLPDKDPEFCFQLNRHRFFICMGQAYWLTGDEKYARHFVRLMTDWIEKNPFNEHTGWTTWRQIETGIRGEYWTKAISYFSESEALTEEFMQLYVKSVREHLDRLMNSRRGMQISSNWGVLENHGMYLFGVSLGEEGRNYADVALERLVEEAQVQVFPDGVHWEQACMYHNEVMHCFLEVMLMAQRIKETLPTEICDTAKQMALADVAMRKPDHRQLLSGDSDHTDLRDILSGTAYLLLQDGSTKTAELVKSAAFPILDFESIWDFGMDGEAAYEKLEAVFPQKKDCFLEESGNYFLRSDWGEQADYLHFKNGCLGNGHGHSDKLHIDWCVQGEDVLMDCGRYTYVEGDADRIYLKSVHSHNTLLVDQKEYMIFTGAWGTKGDFKETRYPVIERNGLTLLGGGHTGYLQNPNGAYVERKVLRLEDGLYLLFDTGISPAEHTYTQLFHFNNEGELRQQDNTVTYFGKEAEAQLHFLGEGLFTERLSGKLSRYYNEYKEHSVLAVNRKEQGICPITAVLHGGKKGSISLQTKLVPVENPVSGSLLPEKTAIGIEIWTNAHHYTVIARNKDLNHPADLLRVGDCMGMGRLLVSKDGARPTVFA